MGLNILLGGNIITGGCEGFYKTKEKAFFENLQFNSSTMVNALKVTHIFIGLASALIMAGI